MVYSLGSTFVYIRYDFKLGTEKNLNAYLLNAYDKPHRLYKNKAALFSQNAFGKMFSKTYVL